MMRAPYIYRVVGVLRVIDGDTYNLAIDVGFHLTTVVRVRLDGWDTPELHADSPHERQEAHGARMVAQAWLAAPPGQLWVRTEKDTDSFGRWLGDVWAELDDGTQQHLGDNLAQLELATTWPTRWRDVYGQGDSSGDSSEA